MLLAKLCEPLHGALTARGDTYTDAFSAKCLQGIRTHLSRHALRVDHASLVEPFVACAWIAGEVLKASPQTLVLGLEARYRIGAVETPLSPPRFPRFRNFWRVKDVIHHSATTPTPRMWGRTHPPHLS